MGFGFQLVVVLQNNQGAFCLEKLFLTHFLLALKIGVHLLYVKFVLVTAEALFENAYKTHVSELTVLVKTWVLKENPVLFG